MCVGHVYKLLVNTGVFLFVVFFFIIVQNTFENTVALLMVRCLMVLTIYSEQCEWNILDASQIVITCELISRFVKQVLFLFLVFSQQNIVLLKTFVFLPPTTFYT